MATTPTYFINSPASGTEYWSRMWAGVVSNGETLSVTVTCYSGPNGTGSHVVVSSLTAILWDQTSNAQQGSFTNGGVYAETTANSSVNGHWYKCAAKYSGSGVGSIGMQMSYSGSTPFVPTTPTFSPTSGGPGTSVTLTGSRFTDATYVLFNGTNASSFTVNSDTQITATVPTGATYGPITVGNPAGHAGSSTSYQPGAIFFGDPDGDGSAASIAAIWYGDPSGSGVPHTIVAVWAGQANGVPKRIW